MEIVYEINPKELEKIYGVENSMIDYVSERWREHLARAHNN